MNYKIFGKKTFHSKLSVMQNETCNGWVIIFRAFWKHVDFNILIYITLVKKLLITNLFNP